MTTSLSAALAVIRNELLALKPSGDEGFESLMAELLARMTRLVMRLAKSGSQFGRDATTPAGMFGVAMEAKRYRDDLTLEDLAGKIVLAEHVLAGVIDLYVLGATSAVSDQAQQLLGEVLAGRGITLLTLDWTEHPLPPLAVALATDPAITLAWFKDHAPNVDRTRLEAALKLVRQDAAFDSQVDSLREAVSAANVGYEPLRHRAETWLMRRLGNDAASQEAFGQFLTVADPASPPIPRPGPLAVLAAEMRVVVAVPRVVALLAGEGVGKTWLVAQWWISQPLRPVLLLVAGRRALRLDVQDPLGSIAALLAEQHDGLVSDQAVTAWRKRLERWKKDSPPAAPRFVVVLDGPNERQTLPWADLIGGLAREAHALGGLAVVTCRPAFWETDIDPRLRRGLEVAPLLIPGYSDSELTAALAPAHVGPQQLAPHVREFVRNPRVCRVAVHVLRDLALAPHELTVERLLLAYWQHRLEERGNLVAHNVGQFHALLRAHARAWLRSPERPFERNAWIDYSAAARRHGLPNVSDDLTEIEEGRFLTVSSATDGSYEFRPEALPFALALLITAELRETIARSRAAAPAGALADARGVLSQMLDPVRGFDVLSDVMAAAVGLACLDPSYPEQGRVALVMSWLTLQNVSERAEASIDAALTTEPDAFLRALETADMDVAGANGTDVLAALVVAKREHGRLAAALANRIPRWLGRWARRGRTIGNEAFDQERQTSYNTRREAALAGFTPGEHAFVNSRTVSLESQGGAVKLDRLAARVLASRPLAPHAEGLLAWAFAALLTADMSPAADDVAWVCRLNERDPADTKAAVSALVRNLGEPPSDAGRQARAILLRVLGDLESAIVAADLVPLGPGYRWTRAEQFCDTDPYDPGAPMPSNLDVARQAVTAVKPDKVWATSSKSTHDLPVEDALPGLARFDPDLAVTMLRRIVATAPTRSWDALRSLSWHLRELTPLFDEASVAALEAASDRLLTDVELQGKGDYDWVITAVSAALAPHRLPEAQLKRLLRLPVSVKAYHELGHALVPLPAPELERELAAAAGDNHATARVLLFASAARPALTDGARDSIIGALSSSDEMTALLAAKVVSQADDTSLDDRLLDTALRGASPCAGLPEKQSHYLAQAVANAVIRRGRVDALRVVPAQFLSAVAARLGATADTLLAGFIDRTLPRLLQPTTPSAPFGLAVAIETSDDEMSFLRRLEAASADADRSRDWLLQLSSEEVNRRLLEEHEANSARYAQLEAELEPLGASPMLAPPPGLGLAGLVEREPMRVRAWVDALLAETSPVSLSRAANFGYAIASSYARHDATLAASLFRHLDQTAPAITVVIGPEQISLPDHALFLAPAEPPFEELRRGRFCEAFDDATLADATLAVELAGGQSWLDVLVRDLLGSATPGHVARALTISGFRRETASATEVLGRDWGAGFLGAAAVHARTAYERARWANYWLHEAAAAQDGPTFWRATFLADEVADARALRALKEIGSSPAGRHYHADLPHRLRNASDKARNERKKTLFGQRVPARDLLEVLRG